MKRFLKLCVRFSEKRSKKEAIWPDKTINKAWLETFVSTWVWSMTPPCEQSTAMIEGTLRRTFNHSSTTSWMRNSQTSQPSICSWNGAANGLPKRERMLGEVRDTNSYSLVNENTTLQVLHLKTTWVESHMHCRTTLNHGKNPALFSKRFFSKNESFHFAPFIVCVFTTWSSRIAWRSSTSCPVRIEVPVSL